MRLGFGIDPNRCIGCKACEQACRKYKETPFSLRVVRDVQETVNGQMRRYYLSLACNHCESPECFRVCPERTYIRRRDGIVVHYSGRCNGCNRCVRACPFQGPRYNPASGKVEKCDFCVERMDEGQLPACVKSCPVKALHVFDLDKNTVFGETWLPGMAEPTLTKPSLRIKRLTVGQRHFIKSDKI